jgi:hypothetical protein
MKRAENILIESGSSFVSLYDVKGAFELWFCLAFAAEDDNCVEIDDDEVKAELKLTDDELRNALSFCLQKRFLEAIPERGVYRVNHRKSV